ncbi:MAG: hypothetical protein ACYCUV_09405 [Phycisphaerae bacterium]
MLAPSAIPNPAAQIIAATGTQALPLCRLNRLKIVLSMVILLILEETTLRNSGTPGIR